MDVLVAQKVREHLDVIGVQTTNNCKLIAWMILLCGFILSAFSGAMISAVFPENSEGSSYAGLPLVIIFPIATIFFIMFLVKARKIRKSNLKKMAEANSRFHEIYFDFFRNSLFPQGFEFDGIFSIDNSNWHSLNFSFGSEKIVWQISQGFASGGYIISYSLTTTAKKLAGFDLISISEKNEIHDLFKFESVEFTKRFKIEGNNSVQVYKLLTPKIIDNFLKQKNHFLEPKTIEIIDGIASIQWGGTKSSLSWTPDPLDFSKVHWTRKRMTEEVYRKVAVDFARFLENQKLLEPLQLYEND